MTGLGDPEPPSIVQQWRITRTPPPDPLRTLNPKPVKPEAISLGSMVFGLRGTRA